VIQMNLTSYIKDIDLFSPYIVVAVIMLYVLLATVGYAYHIRNLQWASSTAFLYVTFGTIIFIMGALIPKLIARYSNGVRSVLSTFNSGNNRIEDSNTWYSCLKILLDERVLLFIVMFALFLQGLNLYLLGGIPLLSGYLKFKATTDLWRVSYIIFLPALNLLLAKYPRKWYIILFVVGLGLFTVNGYRTTTIAIVLSVLITAYYVWKLKTRYVVMVILLIAILGITMGYIAVMSIQWQTWVLNPLQILFYRAGFTMMVLDRIVHMPGFTGGKLFHQALTGGHPRVTVAQVVLGYPVSSGSPTVSITSTVFGPAILDFGAIGLTVQMFLLGLILRLMHGAQKMVGGVYTAFYAIILAHTMIWVETGPTDSIVWIFYVLAVISLLIFTRQLFWVKAVSRN